MPRQVPLKEGMYQFIWNPISLNQAIDLALVISVVSQSIEDLRQSQVWEVRWYFFREHAHSPQFHDGAHRRLRTDDNGLARQQRRIGDDIRMGADSRHDSFLS